jgi:hypothetical protein
MTVLFWKINHGVIPANKAYLPVQTSVVPARGFDIVFSDEATDVKNINRESMANENYYNLNGQRVYANQKGLYIVNGKKVVIK